MVDEDGRQWREAGAYWVTDEYFQVTDWPAPDHKPKTIAMRRDGWFGPNHDYEGQDGWADWPRRFNAHPMQNKWMFTEATHWMPIPEGPQLPAKP